LKLDSLAVRCWPEFFTELGCAACGALSLLSGGFGMDKPIPCSCEADINGTLTQLMLQSLSDESAFGTDIVGVDLSQDRIALWHCGMAPFTMANPNVLARGDIHSNRRLPLVMDFPLKPGTVTFARLNQSTGDFRLVLGKGMMLDTPKPFRGTSGTMQIDFPAQKFLDTIMDEGLEHHISLTYADHLESLKAFAKFVGIPVLLMNGSAA
jgi:L-fucose isomerase-like protein